MEQPISFTPWKSIKAGAVGLEERVVGTADALESPCATCRSSPCCSHLPVHNFTVTTLAELSFAAYLLNFEGMRLGLNRLGEWTAYYVAPCRFLDRESFACMVHGTADQPNICVNYNPYTCWYKRALTQMVTDDFVLVDRARLAWLEERVMFDELRSIVGFPTFDEIVAGFSDLSDEPSSAGDTPVADPAFDGWEAIVLAAKPPAAAVGDAAPAGARAYDDHADHCSGCSAPCCDTLTFGQGLPTVASTLDYYKFCLGFPGVELTITDAGWWLTIKTRCRHLTNGRCGIYGQPERPLQCRYYDAQRCTYRVEYGQPRPAGVLRARLEHFPAVLECLSFDDTGAVTGIVAVEAMRDHVEQAWRAGAAVAMNGHPPSLDAPMSSAEQAAAPDSAPLTLT